MNNIRILIDSILQLLDSGNAKFRDAVEPLANQYVEAVKKANQRLHQCEAHLREGNRSEAIRECEEAPNLLDLFTLLNFPRKVEWQATIFSHQLASPERLLEEIAQELNEAYDKEKEVNTLLKSHRLLALARRPAIERLPTLRSLAQADPRVMHWETDIRTLEKVRLSEIEKEMVKATEQRNPNRLLMLERELDTTLWLEKPPRSLLEDATRRSKKIREEAAKKELQKLAQQLNDEAYQNLNVALGRRLRSSWQAKLRVADLRSSDPLQQQVADALAWLAEEDARKNADDEYRQAMAALNNALDEETSRTEIERLYAAIVRLERDIPETLTRRTEERLDNLDQEAKIKGTRIIVLGTVVVLALGAITWFSLSRHQFNRQVAGHETNVRALVDQNKLDEAESYLNKLEMNNQKIFSRPEIQRVCSECGDATQKEKVRAAKVRTLITKAQGQIKEGGWNRLLAAGKTLNGAKNMAHPGGETDAIAELEEKVATKQQVIQEEVDKQYGIKFSVWQQKIPGVDKNSPDALRMLSKAGLALLENGRKNTPPISAHYQSLTSDLAEKLGTWRQTALQAMYAEMAIRNAQKTLEELDRAIGDADRFSAVLQLYRTRYMPEQDNSTLAKQTEADMKAFASIQKVNAFLDRIAAKPLSRMTPEAAEQMIGACKTVLADKVGHPVEKTLPRYITVLESVVARKDDGAWITNALNNALCKPFIIRLKSVVVREKGETLHYYFRKKPRASRITSNVSWRFDAFVDFDLEDDKSLRVDQVNILHPKLNNKSNKEVSFDWTAPQQRVAEMLLKRANRVKQGGDWELEFSGALEDLDAAPYLEPLLKIQLLQAITEIAAKGSAFLQTSLGLELKLLENPPVDFNADWIWPHDEDGKNARAQARMILQQVRPIKTISENTTKERKALETTLGGRLEWIGYLWKNATSNPGRWKCRPTAMDPALAGDVYALIPPATDGTGGEKTTLEKIGQMANGTVVLSGRSSTEFTPGRPVYLLRTARSDAAMSAHSPPVNFKTESAAQITDTSIEDNSHG